MRKFKYELFCGLNVRATALDGIHLRDLVVRYQSHIEVTLDYANKMLDRHLNEYGRAIIEFKEAYLAQSDPSKKFHIDTFKMGKGAQEVFVDGRRIMIANPPKPPPLSFGQDGYIYRSLEVSHRFHCKHKFAEDFEVELGPEQIGKNSSS
jgi:hypothetical protein